MIHDRTTGVRFFRHKKCPAEAGLSFLGDFSLQNNLCTLRSSPHEPCENCLDQAPMMLSMYGSKKAYFLVFLVGGAKLNQRSLVDFAPNIESV